MANVKVWFDGGCPLCRREIATMQRLDKAGAIEFIDVSSNHAAQDGTCPIDRGALLERFHAEEDGRLLSGAAAFAAMWRAIPLLRPLGLLARNQLILAALEQLYRGFLRIRPSLQSLARRIDTPRTSP
jgi:predicted DCC family thiol-disulfide oxidoreductase YuxK